jgi:hypothetical protein
MRVHTHLSKTVFGKTALAAAALSGLFLFAGTPHAKAADRREDCERPIARTEYRLHEAIEDHGYYSRQANHWRHELREAYEHCDRYRDRHERRYRHYNRDRYYRDYDRR